MCYEIFIKFTQLTYFNIKLNIIHKTMETKIKVEMRMKMIKEHSLMTYVLDIEEGGTKEEQKNLQRFEILIYIKSIE